MRTWLKDLRKQLQLSQKALGKAVGVSDVAVTLWESGTNRPSYDKMLALAKLLGPEVMDRFAAEAQDGRVA